MGEQPRADFQPPVQKRPLLLEHIAREPDAMVGRQADIFHRLFPGLSPLCWPRVPKIGAHALRVSREFLDYQRVASTTPKFSNSPHKLSVCPLTIVAFPHVLTSNDKPPAGLLSCWAADCLSMTIDVE